MKTKLISMLLACIMLASLAACANEGPGNIPDESTKETDVQATENVTTEDTTEEDTTEPEETGWQGPGKNPDMEYCRHGIACEFDDATMTLTNASKESRIQEVLWDVEYWAENHYAVVLYDGQEVTEGELQVGMVIQIYHEDELYGEYAIEELHTSIYS